MEIDKRWTGTWWMVRNKNTNNVSITRCKPEPCGDKYLSGSWTSECKDWKSINYEEPFKHLNFPSITYEESPLEIEITETGKVYWYD